MCVYYTMRKVSREQELRNLNVRDAAVHCFCDSIEYKLFMAAGMRNVQKVTATPQPHASGVNFTV